MLDTVFSRGLTSIFGGFLIALVIGATYLWGIISLYITSYFRIVENNMQLTSESTALVFPFMFFGQATAMPLGVKLMKKVSAKPCCLISGICMGAFVYISSYCQSFSSFALIFGIGGGVIIGFIYMIPVAHCYKYFPKKKGMVSGIIVAGSGFGTFLFSIVAVDSINPNNVPLSGDYYGQDIAMMVPIFLRKLAVICLVAIVGGAFFLLDLLPGMDPYAQAHKHDAPAEGQRKSIVDHMQTEFMLPEDQQQNPNKNPFGSGGMELGFVNNYQGGQNMYGQNSQSGLWVWEQNNYSAYAGKEYGYVPPNEYKTNDPQKNAAAGAHTATAGGHHGNQNLNECPRVRDAPTVKIFWMLFLCMMFGANYGLLMSGSYKSFGKKYIHDDKFLSLIGAVGSMGNGLSRFFWAAMLDKFEFKCLYSCLLVINGTLALTVSYAVKVPQVYLVYVLLGYVCYGGHLGMFPAITSQIFGLRNGTQIYGLLFQAFASSNAIQYILVKMLKPTFGYQPIFWLDVGFSAAAMFLINSVELKFDWSQKIRQNNERKRLAAR